MSISPEAVDPRSVSHSIVAASALAAIAFACHRPRPVLPRPPPPIARPTPEVEGREVGEAEIEAFLGAWSAFDRAMRTLPASVRRDETVAAALVAEGVDPGRFLRLHARVAAAWAGWIEQRAHERTAAALRDALEALDRAAPGDPVAAETAARLRGASHPPATDPAPPSPATAEALRRHREALERIFGKSPGS